MLLKKQEGALLLLCVLFPIVYCPSLQASFQGLVLEFLPALQAYTMPLPLLYCFLFLCHIDKALQGGFVPVCSVCFRKQEGALLLLCVLFPIVYCPFLQASFQGLALEFLPALQAYTMPLP